MAAEPAAPAALALACPPMVQSTGDGTFIVRAGRPTPKLTTEQFANHFDVDQRTVRRWIDEGVIRAKFVEVVGKRKLLIRAAAVGSCKKKFRMRKR